MTGQLTFTSEHKLPTSVYFSMLNSEDYKNNTLRPKYLNIMFSNGSESEDTRNIKRFLLHLPATVLGTLAQSDVIEKSRSIVNSALNRVITFSILALCHQSGFSWTVCEFLWLQFSVDGIKRRNVSIIMTTLFIKGAEYWKRILIEYSPAELWWYEAKTEHYYTFKKAECMTERYIRVQLILWPVSV